MTTNTDIVRRFEEAFNASDMATIDELTTSDLVDHNPLPDQKPGRDGFKDAIAFYNASFPNTTVDLHHIIDGGDFVTTVWTVAGAHEGEFLGVPPTGKHVEVEGMNVYRLADGKVTDVWTQFDGLGLMQQIGALPG